MKQVVLSLESGVVKLVDTPRPALRDGCVLIKNEYSVVSPGTENMLIGFGRSNLIQKALSQPERFKEVLNKVRSTGLIPVVDAIKSKLDEPVSLGYSSAGRIIEVGNGVTNLKVGDKVASNGCHAEIVCVPANLTCKLHEDVDTKQGCYTVLSSIALQSLRLSEPTIGETFVVVGLGIVGLITAQLLEANGCRVIGVDISDESCRRAEKMGVRCVAMQSIDSTARKIESINNGRGVDGVIIATNTSSSDPIELASLIGRVRSRVVLVGVAGMQLDRKQFFEKEISFRVSCSYGPGRYDSTYESEGIDYPIGYVRWTENRNFEAIAELLAKRKLDFSRLPAKEIDINEIAEAYEQIYNGSQGSLLMIRYGNTIEPNIDHIELSDYTPPSIRSGSTRFSVIGTGNYSTRVLIPSIKRNGVELDLLCTNDGKNSVHFGERFGFSAAVTDSSQVFSSGSSSAVVIATRHDSHAELVCRALNARKHVYVEKPLCLTLNQLDDIKSAWKENKDLTLFVGYNRRYSPIIDKLGSLISNRRDPISIVYTCNAGSIGLDHWTRNPNVGGGRLLGEVCHFVDLVSFICKSPVATLKVFNNGATSVYDNYSIYVSLLDGSTATISYLANGAKRYPKEVIQLFSDKSVYVIDDFKSLTRYSDSKQKRFKFMSDHKGQIATMKRFAEYVLQGTPNIDDIQQIFDMQRLLILSSMEAKSLV